MAGEVDDLAVLAERRELGCCRQARVPLAADALELADHVHACEVDSPQGGQLRPESVHAVDPEQEPLLYELRADIGHRRLGDAKLAGHVAQAHRIAGVGKQRVQSRGSTRDRRHQRSSSRRAQ